MTAPSTAPIDDATHSLTLSGTCDPSGQLTTYDDEFARIMTETQDALAPIAGNYISLKNKRFTLPDDTALETLDCIVVDFIRLNIWMPPYQPGVRTGAKCWAINRIDSDLAPGPQVENPVCGTCSKCPNNQFGSRGKGKLCTNRIRLIVAPSDATPNSDLWIVQIPPTGLSDWTHYVKRCEREIGSAGFCRTLSKLSFMPNVDYSKLVFNRIPDTRVDPKTILALRAKAVDALFLDPPSE